MNKGSSAPLDFAGIKERALDRFGDVIDWLELEGQYEGVEFSALNPTRPDNEAGSFKINTKTGLWSEFAGDEATGGDVISYVAYIKNLGQTAAASELKALLDFLDNSPTPSPVGGAVSAPVTKKAKPESGGLLWPIPDDAPTLPTSFGRLGKPSRAFAYKNPEGRIFGYVLRFDTPKGKEIRPLTLWRDNATGTMVWRMEGFPKPRPLYNLDRLAQQPAAPVLIVEGEKAADAAVALFPDYVVTTTPNGAGSVEHADLTPLYGRSVWIWPDNDEPGEKYAATLCKLLQTTNPAMVIHVMGLLTQVASLDASGQAQIESGFTVPSGWDAADAVTNGWTAAHIRHLPESIWNTVVPSPPDQHFGNYELTKNGVFCTINHPKAPDERIRLSSPIKVLALTRDQNSRNWGYLLQFEDHGHRLHEWAMPAELLGSSGDGYRQVLLNRGVDLRAGSREKLLLHGYFPAANPNVFVLCVNQVGWYRDVFVMPHRVFGQHDGERIVYQTNDINSQSPFMTCGSLDDWKRCVASLCVGNSRLMFAVCVALTGPFLESANEENGGFHFKGKSSSGKSKTLAIAASVWGNRGMVNSWRTTGNALESTALRHNDTVLILDEISQVDADQVGDITYMLGNGVSKGRADRSGNTRSIATWRQLFLSSGEIGLVEHIKTGRRASRAGQEIRLLDIPADGGCGMGVFEDLHGAASPQAFAEQIEQETRRVYGTAGEGLLTRLTQDAGEKSRATAMAQQIGTQFLREVPVNSDGQVYRAASRFGLVAGVGEYSIEIGLLPWAPGTAVEAARKCFAAWVDGRGGTSEATEAIRALAQIRGFLENHGESRFSPLKVEGVEEPTSFTTRDRVGFRVASSADAQEYWVLPEAYRDVLCAGFDSQFVTRLLREKGFLQIGRDNKSTILKRLPEIGLKRVYVILPAILQDAEAQTP